MNNRAVIIGAGVGGLATANLLAKAGWDVAVYEQHTAPGGRAGLLQAGGFTFDTGPSWYLMPDVFAHYFNLLGKNVHDYLDLIKLTPAYKVFFDYHQPIVISGNEAQDSALFETEEPGSSRRLQGYLDSAEALYGTATQHFLYNPFATPSSFAHRNILASAPRMVSKLVKPLHSYVDKFVHAQALQQILEYPMVFLGASPYNAPSLYHLMSYLDFRQGVYYPKGGMYEIVRALESIGRELGIQYHYNTPVEHIQTAGRAATGILVRGQHIAADLVISGADLHFTETQLLAPNAQTYPERYWQKRTAGPSALLMYLGVRGSIPELEHHNLFFVQAWRQNFDDIFTHKQWPKQASMYVCKPSATDPNVAPRGHENIFVLVPLPAGEKDQDASQAADHYLAQLEQMSGVHDLRQRIVYRNYFAPSDFGIQFNAWQNTALGMAHLLRQSAFWRPGSRSKKINNLLYVGAGVQPGIGLPMCLISAELALKHLYGDHSAGPLQNLAQLQSQKGGDHA